MTHIDITQAVANGQAKRAAELRRKNIAMARHMHTMALIADLFGVEDL